MQDCFSPIMFKGKRVVVMGLGRFGGGLGVSRWLLRAGAEVTITDRQDADALSESIGHLAEFQCSGRLQIVHGEHDIALLEGADILVVNPAVPEPWNNLFIECARMSGLRVTTEIEIAYRQLDPRQVVAVTGSAGKSTTSAMIHHALTSAGQHSILSGNIGGSLLDQLCTVFADTVVVLELSSAMLYWLWGREDRDGSLPGPKVGCITNCTPNHLDWHGGYEHYQSSKQLLMKALPTDSLAVLGDSVQAWGNDVRANVCVIRAQDQINDCAVLGLHNATNAAMALRASVEMFDGSDSAESSTAKLVSAIKGFTGLAHRLSKCHEADGIVFYNDSKSTVPEATCLAVEALSSRVSSSQIHLIVGGYDKGSDLSSIASLSNQLAGIYTIGTTGVSLAQAMGVDDCITLKRAVGLAVERSEPGDFIVLSPGCASWDQFESYEQRGEAFVSLAKQLTGGHS